MVSKVNVTDVISLSPNSGLIKVAPVGDMDRFVM